MLPSFINALEYYQKSSIFFILRVQAKLVKLYIFSMFVLYAVHEEFFGFFLKYVRHIICKCFVSCHKSQKASGQWK